jgi:serine/threonine protein kinase
VRLSGSKEVSYKGAANFKIRAKIGEGAVGEVYQVIHKQTTEIFALKRVSKIKASMVSLNVFLKWGLGYKYLL